VVTGSFSDIFRGNFEGIGAHVNLNRAGRLIIVSPIEGGPAEAAGIRPGDIILEVDGEVIEGLSLLEAVARIRGPKGTMVQLLVKHLGALDPVLIPVERNVIPLVSVVLRSQPGDKFAHIRLTQFFPNSPEALKEMLQQVIDDGAEGLILDIRDNDGGTLNAVVEIASMFLDSEEQDLVLYVQKGDGSRTNWKIRDVGIAKSMPMVILVNERSASSSEVLAGALQDYKRATVIGTTTFGKGSVNIMRPLSNGGGLYITIAHWYTPFGRIIQGEGLTPDIEVTDRDRQEADIQQLRAAIEELERKTASGS
jgi:carboxyl-terminal processing protease